MPSRFAVQILWAVPIKAEQTMQNYIVACRGVIRQNILKLAEGLMFYA